MGSVDFKVGQKATGKVLVIVSFLDTVSKSVSERQ